MRGYGDTAICKWYRHRCWLVWFYYGGDTTLTVVMPHDTADIEAEQKRSAWQEQGASRGSTPDSGPATLFEPPLLDVQDGWANMRSADDADFCLCLLLPPPGTPGMLSDINESNDAIWKKSGELEAKMDGMKLAVAESNDAMGKEVRQLRKVVRQLKAKVDGLDAKMNQVLRHLGVPLVVNHGDV